VLKKERRQKQPDQLKLPLAPVVAGAKPEGHERQTVDDTATVADSQARTKSGHSSKNTASLIGHAQDPKSKVPQFYCKYHPGRVQNRVNSSHFSSQISQLHLIMTKTNEMKPKEMDLLQWAAFLQPLLRAR
jgi:hypothetical protein